MHSSALTELDGVKLVAVADRTEAKAKSMAARYGAEMYYTDVAALLERKDIDFVCITTANYQHAPLTIQALEAGRHVNVVPTSLSTTR